MGTLSFACPQKEASHPPIASAPWEVWYAEWAQCRGLEDLDQALMLIPVILVAYNLDDNVLAPGLLPWGKKIEPVFLFLPIYSLPPSGEAWVPQHYRGRRGRSLGPSLPALPLSVPFVPCMLVRAVHLPTRLLSPGIESSSPPLPSPKPIPI